MSFGDLYLKDLLFLLEPLGLFVHCYMYDSLLIALVCHRWAVRRDSNSNRAYPVNSSPKSSEFYNPKSRSYLGMGLGLCECVWTFFFCVVESGGVDECGLGV